MNIIVSTAVAEHTEEGGGGGGEGGPSRIQSTPPSGTIRVCVVHAKRISDLDPNSGILHYAFIRNPNTFAVRVDLLILPLSESQKGTSTRAENRLLL